MKETNKPATDLRYIWVTRKNPLRGDGGVFDLNAYLNRYEVIKETSDGYHVRINVSSDSLVYSHEKYDFYDTKEAVLESIIGQSNDMLQALHERKTAYSQLMCEAHDALNAITQK
ncbi:hypothetical protein A8O28_17015 [Enterobacteriaceae bacterium CCUG 67584]|nr:hypothetical protein [Enterobacteriaceae bacterium CCUG 67584]